MATPSSLISKVLVLDGDDRNHTHIRSFCDDNGLVAVKAPGGQAMSVLRSNVDLGAILLWEHYGNVPRGGIDLGQEIHRVRPELPIFLRRNERASLDDLSEPERRPFRAAYTSVETSPLRDAIGASLFGRVYPAALVRGITEITRAAIEGQFRHVMVQHEAPCLVKDRIIYGELFSLIPLESSWCRGYMMLQAQEQALFDFMTRGAFGSFDAAPDFRELNSLLGETTNMVWGAFKNRFVTKAPGGTMLTQVPIIVNHMHRYISFGSEDPLLCVRYHLLDRREPQGRGVVLYQWFAFNLDWAPDNFEENVPSVESLCESGELEMF